MPALISGEEQKSAIKGYKEEETGPNLNEPLGLWAGWHDRFHSQKTQSESKSALIQRL